MRTTARAIGSTGAPASPRRPTRCAIRSRSAGARRLGPRVRTADSSTAVSRCRCGSGRTLEPWFANVLNLGLLVEYDQNVQVNSLLGADLETQLAGLTVFGQVLIDDVQIDRRTQADSEPPSYGLTLGAQGAVGGVS